MSQVRSRPGASDVGAKKTPVREETPEKQQRRQHQWQHKEENWTQILTEEEEKEEQTWPNVDVSVLNLLTSLTQIYS